MQCVQYVESTGDDNRICSLCKKEDLEKRTAFYMKQTQRIHHLKLVTFL